VRRHVLLGVGYRHVEWPEDYDLVLRLLDAGEVGVVPRRLLAWRDAPQRLSRRDPRYGLDRFTACKAFHLARTVLAAADEYVLCGYGSTGRALRRALLAHGKQASHIVDVKTGRIGQRIDGAEVVATPALAGLRGRPILLSVAFEAPRAAACAALDGLGLVEGRDYLCVA
jgi:hypothetical protein